MGRRTDVFFRNYQPDKKHRANIKIVLPAESDEQLLRFIKNLGVEYEFIDARADLKPANTLKRKIERAFQ